MRGPTAPPARPPPWGHTGTHRDTAPAGGDTQRAVDGPRSQRPSAVPCLGAVEVLGTLRAGPGAAGLHQSKQGSTQLQQGAAAVPALGRALGTLRGVTQISVGIRGVEAAPKEVLERLGQSEREQNRAIPSEKPRLWGRSHLHCQTRHQWDCPLARVNPSSAMGYE